VVEVGQEAVVFGHVIAARLVAEHQPVRHLGYAAGLVQVERLDGLHVGPAVEPPGLGGADRRLDLQEAGSVRRTPGQ
jgi:hypothetical protein